MIVCTSFLPVGELRQRERDDLPKFSRDLLCGWLSFHPCQTLSTPAQLRKIKKRSILDYSRLSFQGPHVLPLGPTSEGSQQEIERSCPGFSSECSERVGVYAHS